MNGIRSIVQNIYDYFVKFIENGTVTGVQSNNWLTF